MSDRLPCAREGAKWAFSFLQKQQDWVAEPGRWAAHYGGGSPGSSGRAGDCSKSWLHQQLVPGQSSGTAGRGPAWATAQPLTWVSVSPSEKYSET